MARVNSDGSKLSYATYLGGSGWDAGQAVVVDHEDHVYVTGKTEASTFPITPDSFDTTFGPFRDAFVTKWAGPLPDIRVSGLEITQGIQDPANRIPLVADRITWARGYVAQADPDYPLNVQRVDAELRGYRDGSELSGSPLSSWNVVDAREAGSRALIWRTAFSSTCL